MEDRLELTKFRENLQHWSEFIVREKVPHFPYVTGVDVGATNARVLLKRINTAAFEERVDFPARIEVPKFSVRSSKKLTHLLWVVADTVKGILGEKHPSLGACVDVAGPVECGKKVVMTNYAENDQELSLDMLSPFLFPPGRSQMVNDMESCVHGVLSLNSKSVISTYFDPIFGKVQDRLEQGNYVVVAPGTGLGICLLISSGDTKQFQVIPGESGHMPVAAVPLSMKGGDDDKVYQHLSRKLYDGELPIEYEDVVSGRGLVAVMGALGEEVPETMGAKEIVEKAMNDGDEVAVRSVMVFYRTLMRAIQTLGIAVMCKGIIIAGDNQVINNPLLTEERVKELRETFTKHPRESWLSKMIIMKQCVSMNLNTEGAIYIAKDIALRH
eukprot:TRINITY_DN1312_c0_g1_i1.p1 TRINITY_DN1312_c0_g1~~TRINITY_DN1312_c0_g1_i1.p1  ORF type:complete len:385 (+),score=93.64 TRINITY_DN1312_c0_g1_i1:109-1263(+)